jgi:hypothetical protein
MQVLYISQVGGVMYRIVKVTDEDFGNQSLWEIRNNFGDCVAAFLRKSHAEQGMSELLRN